MKAEIIEGSAPSTIFKKMMIDQNLDNHEIALIFMDEFPDADSVAVNVIWNWKSPTRQSGLDDENFNRLILEILTKSGYM